MGAQQEIKISKEDLKFVVGRDDFKMIISVAENQVFCQDCFGENEVKMIDYNLMLNDLNDIVFKGKCQSCDGDLTKYIETGAVIKYKKNLKLLRKQKA